MKSPGERAKPNHKLDSMLRSRPTPSHIRHRLSPDVEVVILYEACFDALPARLLGWLRAAHPEGRSAEHSMQLPELPQADQAVRQSASQVPSRRQSRAADLALIAR